ncbi:MAG TPA: hypothetical protein PKL97_03380 [Candidatus Omnitrophota bacterium]|nr:hypothetical protein [Candidatus Omnitrophota bacterium]
MKSLIGLCVFPMILLSAGSAQCESLFDEKTKDAASSVVVQVEEDRPVREEENRRYIEHSRDYLGDKLKAIEEKLEEFSKRLEALENKPSSKPEK